MTQHSRLSRAAAVVMCFLLAAGNATTLMAVSGRPVPSTEPGSSASIDFYSRDGSVRLHREARQLNFAELVGWSRSLGGDSVKLDEWKQSVTLLAAKSRRGDAAFAKTLALIDALQTGNREAYAARLREAGVELRKFESSAGLERVVTVHGAVRLRVFSPLTTQTEDSASQGGPWLDDCDGEPCAT